MLYIKRSGLKTLLDGWVDGWVDGRESRVKDCLQQSKTRVPLRSIIVLQVDFLNNQNFDSILVE
jgi:helix-turn-helix protein